MKDSTEANRSDTGTRRNPRERSLKPLRIRQRILAVKKFSRALFSVSQRQKPREKPFLRGLSDQTQTFIFFSPNTFVNSPVLLRILSRRRVPAAGPAGHLRVHDANPPNRT
jgi:hypothetical protein